MSTPINIRLARVCREGDGDHFYGHPFDQMLDDIVGGTTEWSSPRVQREKTPQAKVKGPDVSVELHEGGPEIQFMIEQIPNFMTAFAGLMSAWVAWRSARKEPDIQHMIDKARRNIEISVHNHYYTGQPTPEQVKDIALFLSRVK